MSRVASCFARRETRLTCRDMNGFLMELEDRNCWTLAEAAGHATPYKMQHLLSRAACDERAMSEETASWAAGHLAAGHDVSDVVLIVDETADEKLSSDCAGASRQYSGTVGGTALCQVLVTLTLASPDAVSTPPPSPTSSPPSSPTETPTGTPTGNPAPICATAAPTSVATGFRNTVTGSHVAVSWNAVDTAQFYEIAVYLPNGSLYRESVVTVPGGTFSPVPVTGTYKYKVAAINSPGIGPWSGLASFKVSR